MANISFSLNLSVPTGPISVPQPPPRLNLSTPQSPPQLNLSTPLPPLTLPGLSIGLSLAYRSPGQIAYDKAIDFHKEVKSMWEIGESISVDEYPAYQSPRVGFDGSPLSEGLTLTEADRPTRIRFSATVKVSFGSLESIHEVPLDDHSPAAKRSKSSNEDDGTTPRIF